MSLLLAGLAIILSGGLAALAAGGPSGRRRGAGEAQAGAATPHSWASILGAGGALAGCAVAFVGAAHALCAGGQAALQLPWGTPLGGLHLRF